MKRRTQQGRGTIGTLLSDVFAQMVAVLLFMAAAAEDGMAKAEAELAVVTGERDGLNGKVEGLTKEVGGLTADNGALVTKVEDLGAKNEGLATTIEGLAIANAGLTDEIGGLTADNGALVAKIDTLGMQNEGLVTKIEGLAIANAGLTDEIGGLVTENRGLVTKIDELDKLRPGGPVDIVLLVDLTSSMKPHVDRLKMSLSTLFRWTPRLSSECRVAVLGVRDGVVARRPLAVVRPPGQDDSQKKLLAFIDDLRIEGSPMDHGPGFSEAAAMLSDGGGRRQVIVCLSDIGQSERDGDPGFYSPAEERDARRIVANVHSWASASPDRSVACVYVATKSRPRDEQFFRELAQPAGQNYAADSADLFRVIFNAIESK